MPHVKPVDRKVCGAPRPPRDRAVPAAAFRSSRREWTLGHMAARLATVLAAVSVLRLPAQAPPELDAYDVVWRTPSADAAGSMPIGNGEVGCNVWVTADGVLHGYVSRTDSFSEAARLLKLGRFEIAVRRPVDGEPFEQRLCLRDGLLRVVWGAGERRIELRLFVDSAADVIHVVGEAARSEQIAVSAATWRTTTRRLTGEELKSSWTMQDAPESIQVIESADLPVLRRTPAFAMGFHHHDATSIVPLTLRHQGLETAADTVADPLLHRDFGLLIGGTGLGTGSIRDPHEPVAIVSRATTFAIAIAAPSVQSEAPDAWEQRATELLAAACADGAAAAAEARTAAWWRAFHARSWILARGDGIGTAGVPVNAHPLRIGVDSTGGNRFVGTIERVRVERDGEALFDIAPTSLPVVDTEQAGLDLRAGFTIRATVTQDPAHGVGRIVDKVTAGGGDGILFDTHPGHALRLIVGDRQLVAPAALPGGERHEVEASFEPRTGRMTIRRDGVVVATSEPAAGADPRDAPPSLLTRALLLQRFVQACGGRGRYPIKFNGSIFTVDPRFTGGPDFDADWRRWGDCYWWQNTRLPYHPMLAQGDYDMLRPLFELYLDALPLARARTRIYHGASGTYFPETMTLFGTYSNRDYGWDRTGHAPNEVLCPWWQYAWNQGPELVALMLDRQDYAPDDAFVRDALLPMADAVLEYFATRFPRDTSGRLRITPTQALETHWYGVVDDLPTVAGLHDVLDRLLAMPADRLDPARRERWTGLRDALPPIPLRDVDGVRMIAPAAEYDPSRQNVENPELYAVFPFRRYGLGRPDLDVARATFARRAQRMTQGWTQDGQQAALLGLADEAAANLAAKVRNANPRHRFPVMWGPNFDWLPDQDHGSNLLTTAQCMLLQPVGGRLLVLPAWPRDWDVSFRLHAPGQTVVELEQRGGEIVHLEVSPPERRADVVLPAR
ncbi:MAG: hypothetical protein IPM29_03725 [Planctomycetes bacterium]|nr:hypothetical protein [Planctomycetota bacterium]